MARGRLEEQASIGGLLRGAADRWPGRRALEAPSATLTYATLDSAVTAAAHGLLAAGARPGSHVAFALSHDAAAYLAPFACDRAGLTGILLDTSLAPPRWARQLEAARPTLCVADDTHAGRLAAAGATVASAREALATDGLVNIGTATLAPSDPLRPVVALPTSGSTGAPATVALDGRGLAHVGRAYLQLLDLGEHERSLVVMPLHSVAALSTQTMTMLLVGGCNVVPGDTRPAGAAERLDALGITLLDAAPSWLGVLARQPARAVPTWRTLVYGGEPMPPATVRALAARYPRVAMFDVWGLTEAHGPVTAQRHDPALPLPHGSVGHPLAGVAVRAAGPGGPLPAGEPGELEIAGPSVARGLASGRYREGWLATGDLGSVAEDGSVRLLGRRADLIVRGGRNISVREVEDVVRAAAGVDDAAAFPISDGLGTDAVGIAVVAGSGLRPDRAALRRLVATEIGRHAVPRVWLALDELPRTATGKVDRHALRTAASEPPAPPAPALSRSRSGRSREER